MKKIIKFISYFSVLSSLLVIGYLNVRFYYSPEYLKSGNQVHNVDVYKQLQFLKSELRKGAGEDMQNIYPEGFIFINALYGLSWSEVIEGLNHDSELYKEGIIELSWVVNEVLSPEAKLIFDENLPLNYGAFYMGWSTYILGKKLSIQNPKERPIHEVKEFKKRCRMIAYALENQNSPYLESYHGHTWPADGVIAVAALNVYNKYLEGNLQEEVKVWLGKVKKSLDKEYQLIPHYINAETNTVVESARGCSQSLILNFIYDIDTTFAKDQFSKYSSLFLEPRLGFLGIREYPKGKSGSGDVDSGPVIWGIGGAASIVGQRTFGLYGRDDVYKSIRNTIEIFGLSITRNGSKYYLLGQLPMMDAFFAWSNALKSPSLVTDETLRINWQLHGVSLILMFFFYGFIRKIHFW